MTSKEKQHISLESFPLNSLSYYHCGRTDRAVVGILFFFLLLYDLLKKWGRASKDAVAHNHNSTSLVLPALGFIYREDANRNTTKTPYGFNTKCILVLNPKFMYTELL